MIAPCSRSWEVRSGIVPRAKRHFEGSTNHVRGRVYRKHPERFGKVLCIVGGTQSQTPRSAGYLGSGSEDP